MSKSTAALFSSTDAHDQPLDANYTIVDFDSATMASLIADCKAFQEEMADYLVGIDSEDAGYDFWFTRNRHGCGFWDGDVAEPAATELTNAAHRFGEVYLVVDNCEICM